MTTPIGNNHHVANLDAAIGHWRADKLHLYKLSSNGELQLKTGGSKVIAWILNGLGLTNQNQLYLKMAPDLLKRVNEDLQRLDSPNELDRPMDANAKVNRERTHIEVLQKHREIEGIFIDNGLLPDTLFNTGELRDIPQRLKNYEACEQLAREALNKKRG